MAITPEDIHNVKFKNKVRGYNEIEVDDYLDQVAISMQSLIDENQEYQKKLAMAQEQLAYLKNLEQTLRDTLITAQRSADETTRASQRKAETIVKTAEEQGEAIKKKARDEAAAVTRNLDMLREQAQTYARQFRSLMNAQLRLLAEHGLGDQRGEEGKRQGDGTDFE